MCQQRYAVARDDQRRYAAEANSPAWYASTVLEATDFLLFKCIISCYIQSAFRIFKLPLLDANYLYSETNPHVDSHLIKVLNVASFKSLAKIQGSIDSIVNTSIFVSVFTGLKPQSAGCLCIVVGRREFERRLGLNRPPAIATRIL